MSDGIRQMVSTLLSLPAWKPDRWATQREKTCTRCKKVKSLEKFSFSASLCKDCDAELSKSYRKAREKK